METLMRDLRWTFRTLRRHRTTTFVVVLTLGLAIGANTAVFSVVHALLLRPLPIEDIDRVVRVREDFSPPEGEPDPLSLSSPTFFQWREHAGVFEDLAAGTSGNASLTGTGEPERLSAARITWNLFPLLGLDPVEGRHMRPEEDVPGAGRVVLLGHSFRQRRFGPDEDVLGRVLTLDGQPHTVIGVMPPKLRYPYDADLWMPLQLEPDASAGWYLNAVARLEPGLSVERAEAELSRLAQRLAEEEPRDSAPLSAELTPFREEITSGLDRLLLLISLAGAFVLVIACVNVANLLLAQSLDQVGDVGIRLAMGAGRGRLVRQFATYGVVLALAAGVLGLLFSLWGLRPLSSLITVEALRHFDIEPRINLVTFGFMLAVSLVVGIVFGLIPALQVSGVRLRQVLTESGRSGSLGLRGRRVLGGFVVAEVALALVLVVVAGLVFQSFQRLHEQDRGFDVDGVLSFEVTFPESRYPDRAARAGFLRQATDRLRALPGVMTVAATTTQPLDPGQSYAAFNVEGRPAANDRGYYLTHTRTITPDYFDTLGIDMTQGRTFRATDDTSSAPVVIVSESFAERYWPGQDPLGQRVKRGLYDMDRPWIQVVGVVDTLEETGEETDDAWYLPYTQDTVPDFNSVIFMVRTEGNAASQISAARQAIWQVDPEQPVYDVATMRERLDELTRQERSSAQLYGFLGLLGLLLAALGIYGILSFSVRQRMREIGIRAAIGARPGELRSLVLSKALGLTAAGLVLGLLGAWGVSRWMSSQLFEIEPGDPLTLALSLLGVAAVAFVSSVVPARRAAAVDPVRALRAEGEA